ncbi:hypothetical protein THAOC_25572 [Thalassiosira oceanica]|uniref:Uncharacterized protein n=1 Tax=Thalassiosira oceanica TaxID=159749 RepID=K0RM43_THAOC|nr:hypothetical protein THAOC_25572 [Thalassiosira oceanica]|eukprot:EJK54773.1 hypothetical protein THAOC_25572 [Thalassiosira oceanica]
MPRRITSDNHKRVEASSAATNQLSGRNVADQKIKVHFVAVGSAPMLKRSKFKMNADDEFMVAISSFETAQAHSRRGGNNQPALHLRQLDVHARAGRKNRGPFRLLREDWRACQAVGANYYCEVLARWTIVTRHRLESNDHRRRWKLYMINSSYTLTRLISGSS